MSEKIGGPFPKKSFLLKVRIIDNMEDKIKAQLCVAMRNDLCRCIPLPPLGVSAISSACHSLLELYDACLP
jgi:hypothetical protein